MGQPFGVRHFDEWATGREAKVVPHDDGLIQRHDARFVRIEQSVAILESRMTAAEVIVDRLDEDIYNHGQDGLKTQFTEFLTEYRTRSDERDRRDTRGRWVIGILVTVLLALFGGMASYIIPAIRTIMEDYYQRHPNALMQHSSSVTPNPVYAVSSHQLSSNESRLP